MKRYTIVVLLLAIFGLDAASHRSHLSDGWFAHDAKRLQDAVVHAQKDARTLYDADVERDTVKAIVTPHAGIAYSGTVAAATYSLVGSGITRIIVLAPDHSGRIDGIAVPSFDSFTIPTGSIAVDMPVIKQLLNQRYFNINDAIFSAEHSLEMQLPFIAYFAKQAAIVPLIVGPITCQQADEIARSLAPYVDKNTLVVVTSDFVHYGKRFNFTPFQDHQQLRIRALNSRAIELIEQGKCEPFAHFLQATQATICGANPLKILLSFLAHNAFGAVEPRLIAYDTSSKSDNEDSVSYVGMLFTSQRLSSLPIEQQLTQQEKRGVLQEAKDLLHHLFDTDVDKSLYYPIKSFGLVQHHGAFTTLKKSGELRGCIGRIVTDEPLYKTVAQVTQDAALRDTRFSPVTKNELANLELKVSVLSPLRPIDSPQKIILGKHGILLQQNGRSALFLPEVATEFKWNLAQTLEQLAAKAGLSPDAWKDTSTRFKIFSTVDI